VDLGRRIQWLTDYKTGHSWAPAFMRDIEYNNLDRDSDVKFPWELSRVQWLIPAAQAYLLTGEERYPRAIRDVLDQWIAANPYAGTVNWSCTMEAALRIVSWSWLFHACQASEAWSDGGFRERFLTTLFLHGRFTEKYLERSDVNGNHCTADAAGLVFAGLFFGDGPAPRRWLDAGWSLLCEELPKQVSADGVDYEGSLAYHRLVTELFLFPALYREIHELATPAEYRRRVTSMARFISAYSRPDGSSALLGDADDARMLPLGGQAVTDHRYLIGIVGVNWDETLLPFFSGPLSEVYWTCGAAAARRLARVRRMEARSCAFTDAGYFVMRKGRDHVFVDCAAVGLAGRGGHGHNDCLSFEAVLDGVRLISDCGAFVYTASVEERNRFRSTGFHNTPRIDGQEINRFVAPDSLWQLVDDAEPEQRRWTTSDKRDMFEGSHSGYMRLDPPVRPVRRITLSAAEPRLRIEDRFEGEGTYDVEIPLHLAPGTRVERCGPTAALLLADTRAFLLTWTGIGFWNVALEGARVSPSYGVARTTRRLVWRGRTSPSNALVVEIRGDVPAATSGAPDAGKTWA
jgi:hypothetical protein